MTDDLLPSDKRDALQAPLRLQHAAAFAMTKSSGRKHSAQTRAKIGATNLSHWEDPAKRARVSEAKKARMSDPAVRQRIRDGMRRASGQKDELRDLLAVWATTSQAVQARFILGLMSIARLQSAGGDGCNG